MILNLFFRFLALWVVFHTSHASAARNRVNPKDKLEGRLPPQEVKLPSANIAAWSTAGRKYPSEVLMGVLRDQLNIDEPEKGPVYIFTQFMPGAIYEDIVNGGKHVLLITAQWGNGIEEFKADLHHLALNDCKETEYDTIEFDYDEAYNAGQ
ncbi:hypothetical protein DM02DRAFT_635257 [Periconia macrospinosa]|uniref:Uncharacterized protein n=1 Tax=Periconia macrospinosa TaxID=97972 RepID=A0A2V1D3D6_9PLEO|nr:hypothetical protein DM02DRAFT_635257 [Periconia macrospinosa]